ncbi:MAG: hypothetical protein F7B20_01685 [Aeropyrum sp.]|nr:hypothetical protein [Aeropyrum sp.]MCE4616234.1 hypothetical protein [Aeropyrum sp.]
MPNSLISILSRALCLKPHLAVAAFTLAVATVIHDPRLEGYVYSDIVSLYKYRVAILEGREGIIVPYRDFFLEYPPLAGLVWLASVNIRLPGLDPLISHYYIQALVAAVSGILAVEAVARLTSPRRAVLAALLPSMLVYSVYNWDLIALAPLLWGLYQYRKGGWLSSGLLIGLGGSAKLLPLVAAAPLALHSQAGLRAYSIAVALTALAFAGVELAAPGWFRDFYEHHSGWYIEGSILLLFGDPFSPELRRAAQVLAAVLVVAAIAVSRLLRADPVEASFYSISAYLLGTYVYTPQMNLFPALLLLSSSAAGSALTLLLLLQDTSAALVILVWHWSEDPLDPLSPASLATYSKVSLLALLLLISVLRRWRVLRRSAFEGEERT